MSLHVEVLVAGGGPAGAAAALVLSVAPKLTEKEVRDILTGEAAKSTADGKLDPKRKWNKEMGWGRLDIHAALRRALHH